MSEPDAGKITYPLRTASRLTGLSPSSLRAWEQRYGAVVPIRTAGGTRRYTAEHLERLRRIKAAVDAGHRVSRVADLSDAELEALAAAAAPRPSTDVGPAIEAIVEAFRRLDSIEAQRLLSLQFSMLGPVRFASDLALPLAREIGAQWARGDLDIASEHLATRILSAMLGSALQPDAAAQLGQRVIFATPSGERHELGLHVAALAAMGAGANPIYLGSDVPVDDILAAVERTEAGAVALSVVTLEAQRINQIVGALRGGLAPSRQLWVGGPASDQLPPLPGVDRITDLDQLARRVEELNAER